jgi:hypothetical protein
MIDPTYKKQVEDIINSDRFYTWVQVVEYINFKPNGVLFSSFEQHFDHSQYANWNNGMDGTSYMDKSEARTQWMFMLALEAFAFCSKAFETKEDLIRYTLEMHSAKNSDYGNQANPWTNIFACERVMGLPAEVGIMVRLLDKVSRYRQLMQKNYTPRVEESVLDTVFDIASYACMFLCIEQLLESERAELG